MTSAVLPRRYVVYCLVMVTFFIMCVVMEIKILEEARYEPDNESTNHDEAKRDKVKEMFRHAWSNYAKYAWGHDELRPVSRRGYSAPFFGHTSLGASIVDGLDTLYVMGFIDEFNKGRDWIRDNLNLNNISTTLSAFETNIRIVGGLLSCFSLTGDVMFKDKAVHVADKLLPVFNTATGIPMATINTQTGNCYNYGWADDCSILSEMGTFHLEFSYLSDVTGDPKYKDKVDRVRHVLDQMYKPMGLYSNFINPESGNWGEFTTSLGGLGDSFYEYLLKSWLQSGFTDVNARRMFDEAMQPIITHMIKTSAGGQLYVTNLKSKTLEHRMEHLACFAGGMFGLASTTLDNQFSPVYMEIAEDLTSTCHDSYIRSKTGLGPDAFWFTNTTEARGLGSADNAYLLRPETVESYFVLWRLTRKQKYRDWGWEAVQALEKHCRAKFGYSGLSNVYLKKPLKDDVQQSYFLAETLKYLYLLFSDASVLSLDEWVFNTEAHPLPIRGANRLYRQATTYFASEDLDWP